MTTMTKDETYNGWANYQTWNVALWLGNDEGLYSFARGFTDYKAMVEDLRTELNMTETPDGVAFNDSGLDVDALNRFLAELSDA